ncbi:MAG TPA: phosphoenolpyruvate carboxykinase domain-containing protein, partial [Arthrobacter sp.]|nr:phosphoenolpyruvate carboxykinase domain-containing protein [Arthrobacter sp.]
VLKWVIERIEGTAEARETPIGYVPTGESMDLTGLKDFTPADVEVAVAVDPEEWKQELAGIEEWYANFGESLPRSLQDELAGLKQRLA